MGRIYIHLHGRPKEKSIYTLIEIYSKRLESESMKLIEHPDNLSPEGFISKLVKTTKNGVLILLEQNGKMYNSIEFSSLVKSWRLNSQDIHLAIGPAIGFPSHDFPTISLSKMTYPHELAAVILIEQVYRSIQIIKGTKYHK